jgi:hypothetical protein
VSHGVKTVRYLTDIPRKPLPPGQLVVHNHVRPQPRLGMNGFRAWIARSAEEGDFRVVRCACTWAPELAEHYRVDLGADGGA